MPGESSFRALITGIGDAFSHRYFGSSALIDGPQGYVLLDCPGPIHRVLETATQRSGWNLNADAIHDILLTHLHGDHFNGLEAFGFWRYQRRLEDPTLVVPRVYTSAPTVERMWERLAPAMDRMEGKRRRLEDFFDVHALEPGATARICGLSVRCRLGMHSIPCLGFLIDDGNWALGWSGDTAFDPGHIEWLAQADIVVHESNHGSAHTPIEALNALPAPLRAKMRLIHLPDDFAVNASPIARLKEGTILGRPAGA